MTAAARTACDGAKMIADIIDLYGTVLAEHRAADRDELAERRALSRMLRNWVPVVNLDDRHGSIEPTTKRSALRSIGTQIAKMEGQ